jgi:hypothetical protein
MLGSAIVARDSHRGIAGRKEANNLVIDRYFPIGVAPRTILRTSDRVCIRVLILGAGQQMKSPRPGRRGLELQENWLPAKVNEATNDYGD